jgi:ribosomal protein S1
MPASQVDIRRIEDLSVFVGEKLKCLVVRVDRTGRGQITLSRKEIARDERKAELETLKSSLKEGDVREGIVRKIMPFGAFVDIGGVDGLLHVSDLKHERVNKVEDVVKEGDKVTVKVLKLDWEAKRHSLGLKQLQADPFAEAAKDVVEGALLTGRVTKLMEFGAFVELAPGVEGLVHISELAWSRVAKTSDVVQPNKVVKVKVLKLDPASRKISLSIKQATDRPADEGPGGRRGRPSREEDTRKAEEILKETPQLRRMREQAAAKHGKQLKSGLGSVGSLGLGDLKL